jgi:hypothetical protein
VLAHRADARFFELIKDLDAKKVQRVTRAMFQMIKFDIAGLEKGVPRRFLMPAVRW